jgi:murein DD-endopeptidase MepM/ murein hydrolase activator NlpD
MSALPTVRNSASNAQKKLEEQLAQLLGGTSAKVPDAVRPAEGMYGVFSNAYAADLAKSTGAAGADIINHSVLRDNAIAEREEYARMIKEAQIAQERMQTAGYFAGLQQEAMKQYLPSMDRGVAGVIQVGTDAQGRPVFKTDPVKEMVGNSEVLNNNQAERYGIYATAQKSLSDAGFRHPTGYIEQLLKPPTQKAPAPVVDGYMNPADKTARINSRTHEQDMELAEAKARYRQQYGDPDDEGVEWKQEINPRTGRVEWVAKGSAAALTREGHPPPGLPNPKADAQGSGASAIPATEFYRNPNSRKGVRKDPFTGKSKMHNGDDFSRKENTPFPAEDNGTVASVGPVKGFGPNTVIVDYEDGRRVLYGHGNKALVQPGQKIMAGMPLGLVGSKGRSTGPHVHRQELRGPQKQTHQIRTADNQPTRIAPQKVYEHMAKTRGAMGKTLPNGDVEVTLKTGRKLIYRNGVRVNG